MDVNFEGLLERSNDARNFVQNRVEVLTPEKISWKESPKKWSVLEVVSHLNQVYQLYFENLESALEKAPDLGENESLKKQKTLMGRMSVYSMKPKGKKRRFKMKTFDFFEPVSKTDKPHETIQLFFKNKDRFNAIIRTARLKDLKDIKLPTALGDKMKFYFPEIIDFLISHEERHLVQMEGIMEKIPK